MSSRRIERLTHENVAARVRVLREATAVIEARAKERHREDLAAFEAKRREREEKQKATGKPPRGREPKPPQEGPRAQEQCHFTDPESRVMSRAERDSQRAEPLPAGQRRRALAKPRDGFAQTCDAQAAVAIQSRLVVSPAVSDAPNDKEPLLPTLGCVSPVVKSIGAVLNRQRILQRSGRGRRRARPRGRALAEDLRRHSSCASSRWRRWSRVVASGTASLPRSMSAKLPIAWPS